MSQRVSTSGFGVRDLPRVILTLIGWIEFVVGCLVWGLVFLPAARILSVFTTWAQEWFRAVTRLGLRFYIASLGFFRLRVDGGERLLSGSRLVVANHQSWLDPIVLLGRERNLVGPARTYMFRVPLVGWVLDTMGFVPADLGEASAFARIRARAESVRGRGDALLFFPEGTRSRTGAIGPFQRGAFRLAVDLGLPIQPVVIDGLNVVLPPGHLIAQARGRPLVRLRSLEPVCPPYKDGPRRQVVRELAAHVRDRMVAERDAMRTQSGER
ncbi:MAG: 1-acyl-sn-glycerol-3-phosphate acyltransferase [Myxococcales bacterium]|nr:MAG: 1-acyl-sn-glycerol-3-phosphate acyltransferase [Myxococcales bacterium]